MSTEGAKKVVIAALVGNAAIAVSKSAAAAYTGSSAMLSEAIHSLVDTGNQALILYGIKRSQRPADDEHPFGYGMELYFWSFVVAILIFAVGAGVSLYEGVMKISEPHVVSNPYINYAVLSVAMIFEAAAWTIAFREFRLRKGHLGFFAAIHESKDPAVFTVLMEDTAAMLGLIAAFTGIALGQVLDMPVLDGVASVVIGVILALVAVILSIECKGLLIGESARSGTVRGIRALVAAREGIYAINELLTMHLGPKDILVTLSLDFSPGLSSDDVETLISEMEIEIKASYPEVTRIFVEAQSKRGHLANLEMDRQGPPGRHIS